MTTLESQREHAQQIRLALLAAMQDVGNTKDVVKCDYLSAGNDVPTTNVDLTGICGGKQVDKWMEWRRG